MLLTESRMLDWNTRRKEEGWFTPEKEEEEVGILCIPEFHTVFRSLLIGVQIL